MELLTLAPSSDRIPVELFQILKDDAVESAALNLQYALNMQYAGSRQALTKLIQKYTRKTPRPLSHCCPSHPDLFSDGQVDSNSPRVPSPMEKENLRAFGTPSSWRLRQTKQDGHL